MGRHVTFLSDQYETLPSPSLIKPWDLLTSLQKVQGIKKQFNSARSAQVGKSRRRDFLADPQVLSLKKKKKDPLEF